MKHRVLVVEDDEDTRRAIAECLSDDASLEVETASDGLEALARVLDWTPDLIVLDVVMPGMNGREFMQACRTMPRLAHVPILITTAMNGAEIEGAAERLDKPFDVDQLREAVRHCLNQQPVTPEGLAPP